MSRPGEPCVECGRTRLVAARFPDGPVCKSCTHRRLPVARCARCGQKRRIKVASRTLCIRCASDAVRKLPCRDCGKLRRVSVHDQAGPQCEQCRRRARAEPCIHCNRTMMVKKRTADGPVCGYCWARVRPGQPCSDCARAAGVRLSAHDGKPRCENCYLIARMPCARCGLVARANRHWPEGPVCRACVDEVLSTHAPCRLCHQHRPVLRRDPDGPVCPGCAGVRISYQCQLCGAMGRVHSRNRCLSCAVNDQIIDLFTTPGGTPATRLAPLAEELKAATADRPDTSRRYLRQPGGRLIRRLVSGELACTHEALDALRQTAAVDHLRSLLVLVGLLPARDEQLARLQMDITAILERTGHPEDRLVLTRYARWHLLTIADQRIARRGTLTINQRRYLRGHLTTALRLLTDLRVGGSTLTGCDQATIDSWLQHNRRRRDTARAFLIFAAAHHLAPAHLAIEYIPRADDRSIMNDTQRILRSITLETDESLPLPERVAGCLVLQYGLPCRRIVALTASMVLRHPTDADVLGLNLGKDPLWLRPRLSALLDRLLDERRPISPVGRRRPSQYLFPGHLPNQAMAPGSLAGRLKRLGITSPKLARNGAMLALAGSVHWKLLADLLGIADNTAVNWHNASGRDRASYVASRLRHTAVPTQAE